MMQDPIILEALMWVAFILSLPAIWWAFSVIGTVVGRVLLTRKVINLTVVEDGIEKRQIISLDETDALVQAILNMKGKPSV